MAYGDIGFDEFLNRDIGGSQNNAQALNPAQFDFFTEQIPGGKVQGGIILSPDGKVKLDLDKGIFNINNGVQDLVTLGTLSDGSTGLVIKDNAGNILIQISETANLIQSSNKKMILDFIKNNLSIFDDSDVLVGLLGNLDQ